MKSLAHKPAARSTPSPLPQAGWLSSESRSAIREALRSPGRPLDTDTRTAMESHFGADGTPPDFGQVRLHTDAPSRLGMALLFAESKGLRLNPDQVAFLTLLRSIPGASFASRLAEYDKAGRPPRF